MTCYLYMTPSLEITLAGTRTRGNIFQKVVTISISQIPKCPSAYYIFIFLKISNNLFVYVIFVLFVCFLVCFFFCVLCVCVLKKNKLKTEFLCLNTLINKILFFFKQTDGSPEWLSAELDVK